MNGSRSCFKSTFGTVIFIGALASGTGPASALVIDDFSQGAISITATNVTGQTVVENGLDPSSALGGSRSIYVGSLSQAAANVDTAKGRFNFRADASFGYFTLDWGSVTPLNLNLTTGGNNEFVLNFVDVTPVTYPGLFYFRVKSGNIWAAYDFSGDFHNAFNTQTFGTLTIPFSQFVRADLTQVSAIELVVDRFQPVSALSIDSIITAVPEPTAPTLLGLASLLSLSFRRKGKPLIR